MYKKKKKNELWYQQTWSYLGLYLSFNMEPRVTYPPPPPSLIFLICIMVVMLVPSSEVMVRSDGIMHEYT